MSRNKMFISGLEGNEVIHFRSNHKMECIFLRDITYIESDGAYSNIYSKGDNQKRMVCRYLKEIQMHLNNYGFIRCSRFFLINSKLVENFCSERKTVFVNGEGIIVSVRAAKEVFRMLLEMGIKDTEVS